MTRPRFQGSTLYSRDRRRYEAGSTRRRSGHAGSHCRCDGGLYRCSRHQPRREDPRLKRSNNLVMILPWFLSPDKEAAMIAGHGKRVILSQSKPRPNGIEQAITVRGRCSRNCYCGVSGNLERHYA